MYCKTEKYSEGNFTCRQVNCIKISFLSVTCCFVFLMLCSVCISLLFVCVCIYFLLIFYIFSICPVSFSIFSLLLYCIIYIYFFCMSVYVLSFHSDSFYISLFPSAACLSLSLGYDVNICLSVCLL